MSAPPLRLLLRNATRQVRYVTPVRPGAARGLVARVYEQVERDFGMLAPPVALHSPSPGVLAACWLMLRETLVVPGAASRAAKETVAAAVSAGNACPYCVAVHAAALDGGLGRAPEARAIAQDGPGAIADPALRDLAAWARASGTGEPAALSGAPPPAGQVPELLGVAVTFHYLNRMVSVFLAESPVPPRAPAAMRGVLMRMLGRMMVPRAGAAPPAGASLDLLPAAPPPDDLSWADGDPRVSVAFARAAAAVEEAGGSVPEPVRALLMARLDGWDGRPPPLSPDWAGEHLAPLEPPLRAAGRLALLTAFAPYRVTAADVDAFRAGRPGDEALLNLTAWASLTTARRVGARLADDPRIRPHASGG